MHAIKEARKLIEKDPTTAAARTLSKLVLALESESPFPLAELYLIDFNAFTLALRVLEDWRLDRYYVGKAKLFDLSLQANELKAP